MRREDAQRGARQAEAPEAQPRGERRESARERERLLGAMRGADENRGAAAARLDARARQAARHRSVYRAAALCAFSVCGLTLLRMAVSRLAMPPLAALLAQAAGTLAFTLLPALLGLSALVEERTPLASMGALGPAQIRRFAWTGALAVFPALALTGAAQGVFHALAPAAPAAQAAAAPQAALFLPRLLCEALLAPVCEELFFRGYLLGALSAAGKARAALVSSAVFALAHGVSAALPARFLLGLLFSALTLRADSVLASTLAHGCYNAALVAAAYLGLGPLLGGRGIVSCALQTAGAAAFCVSLKGALSLPKSRRRARLWEGGKLSRREALTLAAALAALALAVALPLLLPVAAGEAGA